MKRRPPLPSVGALDVLQGVLDQRQAAALPAVVAALPSDMRFLGWQRALASGWVEAVVALTPAAAEWPASEPASAGVIQAIVAEQFHLVPALIRTCTDPNAYQGEILRLVAESCPEHLGVALAHVDPRPQGEWLIENQDWPTLDTLGAALPDAVLRAQWQARMPEGQAPNIAVRQRLDQRAAYLAQRPAQPRPRPRA